MKIDFEKCGGLVPAIIQDATTKNVLMLGYMNQEAYEKTIATRKVTFWSRSRNCLWTKGETSGNFLHLVDIMVDCDNDTLLIKANPDGPTCHTGTDTCWGEGNERNPLLFLTELQDFINLRHEEMPEGSYTTKLFKDGVKRIAQKVGEEALESVIEACTGSNEQLTYEVSDMLYHLLVLLTAKGMRIEDVATELQKRHDPNWDKKMLINLKNANICQREGRLVLGNVNLQVNEGDFIYLIGRVGAGKSTLLKTLYCELVLDEADEATVLGHDLLTIRNKEIPALRREMGIVFQDFQLLNDRSVYKNLYFVLKATGWKDKDAINERIKEVLTDIGLADKMANMPHQLSGGEQKRIAIARAILNHPKLIIADEPTSNLDKDTTDEVMQLLRKISETGTAIVMSTHNIALLNKYPGKAFQCQDEKMEEVTVRKA